ncbi:uncharacterized protein CTRU02_205268 [Colletotrichum truncatum]|uniref:Uncharacterized protein n=1 Tax=Colletotrichum truncatum TaxID=5467 RepID=A0ACC3Z3I9_COLTU|nr:uncharacterized protein CTRU02_04324 [Colletotrichum truncatum]KAF6795514.1 hypothetical protein CTRU02_04324 [Colletotrichum truncatum]
MKEISIGTMQMCGNGYRIRIQQELLGTCPRYVHYGFFFLFPFSSL